jgi:hypothetical protein
MVNLERLEIQTLKQDNLRTVLECLINLIVIFLFSTTTILVYQHTC